MIELLAVFFTVTLLCVAIYIEWKRLKLSKIVKHLPGPPEIPVIGSLYALQPKTNNEMYALFDPIYKGPISKIFCFNRLVIFIAEPKAMYQFFTSRACLERPFIMKYMGLDGGLISAKYKQWKPLRKDVNVYFNQRTSLMTIPKFIRHYTLLAEEVGTYVGKEVNLRREMMQRNIKLILETTMDIPEADPRLKSEVMEIVDDCVSKRIMSPTHWLDSVYKFTEDYHEDTTNRSIFNEVFEIYIKQKEEQMKSQDYVDEDKQKIYFDTLFKLRDELNMSLEEVRNNLVTIFLTGYETTAVAMSYTIMMLAMYPEIDKKVEAEIFEHYTPGDEITYEMLKKMTYLEQVLKEAMRLFPPAPLTLRETMEPVELEGIGKLPKGVLICAHMYFMQRSKDVWGDRADEFDPEHFSPEFLKNVDPHGWMPFTAGPRNCIGYAYAMVSMKICLLLLLSQYRFTTTMKYEDIKLRYCINIKLIGKEEMMVHRRRPQITDL